MQNVEGIDSKTSEDYLLVFLCSLGNLFSKEAQERGLVSSLEASMFPRKT
jgi:hypothetical protein